MGPFKPEPLARATPATLRAALLALLLLVPGLTGAGPTGPNEPDPAVPSDLLVSDLRIGPFYVKPLFALRDVGWDNNVYATANGALRDFTATVAPGLRVAVPFGDNVLSIREDLGYHYYHEQTSQRYWSTETRVSLALLLGSIHLDLGESFRRSRQRYNFEVLTRAAHSENQLDFVLGTDHDAGIYFESDVTFKLLRFNPDEVQEQQSLSRALDRNELRGGLSAWINASDLGHIGGGVRLARNRFRTAEVGRDANGGYYYGGFRFDPEGTIQGRVSMGYETLDPILPGLPVFHGLGMEGNLSIELTDSVRLGIHGSRHPEFSISGVNQFYISSQFGGSLRIPLADRFAVEVAPTFYRTSYPVAERAADGIERERADQGTVVSGTFIVQISSDVGLRLGTEWRRRSSNFPGQDYRAFAFTTGFQYGE